MQPVTGIETGNDRGFLKEKSHLQLQIIKTVNPKSILNIECEILNQWFVYDPVMCIFTTDNVATGKPI